MEYLSFTGWIKTQAERNDSVGDLARDIRQDSCWPSRSQNKERFLFHLEKIHEASRPALAAFQKAWREWESLSSSEEQPAI